MAFSFDPLGNLSYAVPRKRLGNQISHAVGRDGVTINKMNREFINVYAFSDGNRDTGGFHVAFNRDVDPREIQAIITKFTKVMLALPETRKYDTAKYWISPELRQAIDAAADADAANADAADADADADADAAADAADAAADAAFKADVAADEADTTVFNADYEAAEVVAKVVAEVVAKVIAAEVAAEVAADEANTSVSTDDVTAFNAAFVPDVTTFNAAFVPDAVVDDEANASAFNAAFEPDTYEPDANPAADTAAFELWLVKWLAIKDLLPVIYYDDYEKITDDAMEFGVKLDKSLMPEPVDLAGLRSAVAFYEYSSVWGEDFASDVQMCDETNALFEHSDDMEVLNAGNEVASREKAQRLLAVATSAMEGVKEILDDGADTGNNGAALDVLEAIQKLMAAVGGLMSPKS
jgi:hypothetical protein